MSPEQRERLSQIVIKARGPMSQRAYARATGLSYDTVQRLERGDTNPKEESLSKLARNLGMSLDDLLGHLSGPYLSEQDHNLKEPVATYIKCIAASESSHEKEDRYYEDLINELEEFRTQVVNNNPEISSFREVFIVENDAMSPDLNPGDTFFIDRQDTDPHVVLQGMYYIRLGEQKTCANLARIPGNLLEITYANPLY
ncbi:helix-turn-helix domain-containing protein, partial [Vacuolonema iberomarrocanum]|uniref:helix-turn-helix domain-containing protein n=1 Tax=Vacuolonema iberomarrocanum TaxID=3454632 RepID=UPI0019E8846E|nr:helix-turn-helix domain-containing protein [filamentous cyanobacterium LEGE 07170]